MYGFLKSIPIKFTERSVRVMRQGLEDSYK
jgi:hypothetical protein